MAEADPESASPLAERMLPLGLPVPTARPTGSIYDKKQPYTLPLNQEVGLIRCLGPYTEIDRKLWATLVAMAWDDLAKKSVHEVNARDIARLFRELKGGDNGSAWVMASARRLMASRLDWKDDEEDGSVTLLAGLRIKRISGAIFYQFSDFLIEKILDNKKFLRLRLHFMIGLSGKYSVTLYMLLESLANLHQPVIELEIDQLRDNLSVPEGKLKKWYDLNRFAIEPAIKQINNNTVAAGFSVQYEPLGSNRKIERVRFRVTKVKERTDEEQSIKDRLKKSAPGVSDTRKKSLNYNIDDALAAIRKNAPGLDAQYVLAEFEEWQRTCDVPVKNPMGALIGFARKKHAEMKHLL
jgi:hypothetical protein